MPLGKASNFSQSLIESSLRLVGSNPPSGKQTTLGHLFISILLRWHNLCRPSGKDLRFSQFQISSCSRDALLSHLSAIDSSFGQNHTIRLTRAVGNWFLNDKDVNSEHPQMSRCFKCGR